MRRKSIDVVTRRAVVRGREHRCVRAAALAVIAVTMVACARPPADKPDEPGQPGRPLQADPLWVADLETGDLSQFADTPWNTVEAQEPAVVSDPGFVRDGRYAVEMTIPSSADSDEGTRSEVQPNAASIEPGDDLYFGFSTLLGPGFPIDASWQVIVQWKNEGEGSPPLSISIESDQYTLSGGAGHPDGAQTFNVPLAPASPGGWIDWVVHIRFSPDPAEGFVEIWHGEEQILPRYSPRTGTMYPSDEGASSYLKAGYYRNAEIDTPGTVYFDNWKIGEARESVLRSAT
jgi:hypothetical protein